MARWHERRGDRRVDAARQRRRCTRVAPTLARMRSTASVDEVLHGPVAGAARPAEEVAASISRPRGVRRPRGGTGRRRSGAPRRAMAAIRRVRGRAR